MNIYACSPPSHYTKSVVFRVCRIIMQRGRVFSVFSYHFGALFIIILPHLRESDRRRRGHLFDSHK